MTSSHMPSVYHVHRFGFHYLGIITGSVRRQYPYDSYITIMQQVIIQKHVHSVQHLKRLCMTKMCWNAQKRWYHKPYVLIDPWFMTYLIHIGNHTYLMVNGSVKAYILK